MKKNSYKPIYKLKLKIKENVLLKKSLNSLKKKKWFFLIKFLKKKNKKKLFDSNIYFKPKFLSFFQKRFKQLLILKQKLSVYFGFLLLKDLKKIYISAYRNFKEQFKTKPIYSLESFFYKLIENRLDIILYRTYFASSIRESRFFIYSGQVLVNGTRTTCNSLVLKKGDCITFKNSLLSKLLFNLYNSKMLHAIPKHLLINYRTFQILIFLDVEKIKLFDLYDFRINFKGLIEKIKL